LLSPSSWQLAAGGFLQRRNSQCDFITCYFTDDLVFVKSNRNPNPDLGIVIASETKQSRPFHEIAAHLSGVRNDRLGKGFLFLNRDLGGTPVAQKYWIICKRIRDSMYFIPAQLIVELLNLDDSGNRGSRGKGIF